MLPNFLILGAPKCGTTTLYEVLGMRPDIFMSPDKDPLFFEFNEEYEQGPEFYSRQYFSRWNGEPLVGEARAAKLMLPYVPGRIHRTVPGARLIIMVRDPVERLVSHWWMRTCYGQEKRSLDAAVESNLAAIAGGRRFDGLQGACEWRRRIEGDPGMDPVYVEFGYYAEQVRRYLEYFPRSRIKILFLEDMQQNLAGQTGEVIEFLGGDTSPPYPDKLVRNAALPAVLWPLARLDHRLGLSGYLPVSWRERIKSPLVRSGAHPSVDDNVRRRIAEHYAPHNAALSRLTGRDLTHWEGQVNRR